MADNLNTLDSLRLAYYQLKNENEKKDNLIKDLMKKLNEALETIQAQTEQIRTLSKGQLLPQFTDSTEINPEGCIGTNNEYIK